MTFFGIAKIGKLGGFWFNTSAVLADRQSLGYRSRFQCMCTDYVFWLANVLLQPRDNLTTLEHDATMVRLWMHQPKNIKHDRYISHGRRGQTRAEFMSARRSWALTELRRQTQPAGIAAVGVGVMQALD